MEKELLRRRFGPPVRLELAEDIAPRIKQLLTRELSVEPSEVYELAAPLDLTGLNLIADLERQDLHYPRFVPTTHRHLAEVESATPSDIFAAIRERDVLLDAAEAGKQVLALVEIKARFDEQANITWARKLEQAGVHVVYGLVGLKTHCKLSLVVRQELDGLRRYCHVGTGNYHPKTARLYEDYGLLTCDPDVGQDLTRLFNQLSGYAPKTEFRRLLVAPREMRAGLIERRARGGPAPAAARPARMPADVDASDEGGASRPP